MASNEAHPIRIGLNESVHFKSLLSVLVIKKKKKKSRELRAAL